MLSQHLELWALCPTSLDFPAFPRVSVLFSLWMVEAGCEGTARFTPRVHWLDVVCSHISAISEHLWLEECWASPASSQGTLASFYT